jgi:hypothetical protein
MDSAVENLTLNKRRLRAGISQLVSDYVQKIHSKNHFSETQTAGSRLLFRSDLVIAQLPHEDFLVYGLP